MTTTGGRLLTDGTVLHVILPAYQLSGLSALFTLRTGPTFSSPSFTLFSTVLLKYLSFGLLRMRIVLCVVSGCSCVCVKYVTLGVCVCDYVWLVEL